MPLKIVAERQEELDSLREELQIDLDLHAKFTSLNDEQQCLLLIKDLPKLITAKPTPPSLPEAQPLFSFDGLLEIKPDVDDIVLMLIKTHSPNEILALLKETVTTLLAILEGKLASADADFAKKNEEHSRLTLQVQRMNEGSLEGQVFYSESDLKTPDPDANKARKDFLASKITILKEASIQLQSIHSLDEQDFPEECLANFTDGFEQPPAHDSEETLSPSAFSRPVSTESAGRGAKRNTTSVTPSLFSPEGSIDEEEREEEKAHEAKRWRKDTPTPKGASAFMVFQRPVELGSEHNANRPTSGTPIPGSAPK